MVKIKTFEVDVDVWSTEKKNNDIDTFLKENEEYRLRDIQFFQYPDIYVLQIVVVLDKNLDKTKYDAIDINGSYVLLSEISHIHDIKDLSCDSFYFSVHMKNGGCIEVYSSSKEEAIEKRQNIINCLKGE